MDRIDEILLKSLATDSRQSLKQLAAAAGLSSPSAAERLHKLEDHGIIRRYAVEIDPAALGFALEVLIRIRPLPGHSSMVHQLIEDRPEIVECDKVTGEDCFVARALLEDVQHIDELLEEIGKHASTSTAVVKSKTVRRRLPPLRPRSSRA